MSFKQQRVAAIIPAHNEALSIDLVVRELAALRAPNAPSQQTEHNALIDTIIVCDNASTDQTAEIAARAGARVVHESTLGYGAACLRALQALKDTNHAENLSQQSALLPDFVIFVDGDYSVKTNEVIKLLKQLQAGSDLVVGNRENSLLQAGALSPHQRFGNALASALIRFIWQQPIADLGPFRGMRYNKLLELDMQDQRFGWTVEMQVKAIQAGLNYTEIPVTTRQRIGLSKISGTIRGTIGAAIGIFGTVFKLYWQEKGFLESVKKARQLAHLKQS